MITEDELSEEYKVGDPVKSQHYYYILENYSDISGIKDLPQQLSALASSSYPTSKEGLFQSGLETSLWNVDGEIVIFASSQDQLLLAGSIHEVRERMEIFNSVLFGGSRPVPSVEIIRRQKMQKSVADVLTNWGVSWSKKNARKILEDFSQLTSYKIGGGYFINKQLAEDGKTGDALLVLIYCALKLYKSRVVEHGFEENLELIEWLEKNLPDQF